jgi:hypothetical protein
VRIAAGQTGDRHEVSQKRRNSSQSPFCGFREHTRAASTIQGRGRWRRRSGIESTGPRSSVQYGWLPCGGRVNLGVKPGAGGSPVRHSGHASLVPTQQGPPDLQLVAHA